MIELVPRNNIRLKAKLERRLLWLFRERMGEMQAKVFARWFVSNMDTLPISCDEVYETIYDCEAGRLTAA